MLNLPGGVELSQVEVETLLAEGIYERRVAEVARALLRLQNGAIPPQGRALARAALSSCAAVSAHARSEREAMVEALRAGGVDACAIPDDADQDRLQTHVFSVRIAVDDLARAMDLAVQKGFRPMTTLKRGAWEAYRRSRHETALVRIDDATTRMRLCWDKEGGRSPRLVRGLRPTPADLRFVELPESFWPFYYGVRFIRLVAERIWKLPRVQPPWPFLGTPQAMIPALLDMADVSAEDFLVDLGCGDGRVLVEASRTRGCRSLGVERNPELVACARKRVAEAGLEDRVEVVCGDAREESLRAASVVFLFLPISSVPGIVQRLRKELAPGARVLAHEQERLVAEDGPTRSQPLFGGAGMTVAHLWVSQ